MYLIIYDYDRSFEANAVSVKDAFIMFADYTGNNSLVFSKAITALQSVEEMVILFERFSITVINAIYQIKDALYKEELKAKC